MDCNNSCQNRSEQIVLDEDIVESLTNNVLNKEKNNLTPSFDSHRHELRFEEMVRDEVLLFKLMFEIEGK